MGSGLEGLGSSGEHTAPLGCGWEVCSSKHFQCSSFLACCSMPPWAMDKLHAWHPLKSGVVTPSPSLERPAQAAMCHEQGLCQAELYGVCCKNPRLGAHMWQCRSPHTHSCMYIRMCRHTVPLCTHVHAHPHLHANLVPYTYQCGTYTSVTPSKQATSTQAPEVCNWSAAGDVPGPQHGVVALRLGQAVTSATNSIQGPPGWWREAWRGCCIPRSERQQL